MISEDISNPIILFLTLDAFYAIYILYFFIDTKMKLHLILAPLLMLAIIKANLEIMAKGNLKLIIVCSIKFHKSYAFLIL